MNEELVNKAIEDHLIQLSQIIQERNQLAQDNDSLHKVSPQKDQIIKDLTMQNNLLKEKLADLQLAVHLPCPIRGEKS